MTGVDATDGRIFDFLFGISGNNHLINNGIGFQLDSRGMPSSSEVAVRSCTDGNQTMGACNQSNSVSCDGTEVNIGTATAPRRVELEAFVGGGYELRYWESAFSADNNPPDCKKTDSSNIIPNIVGTSVFIKFNSGDDSGHVVLVDEIEITHKIP
jgi:hypothetical protein